MEGSQKQGQAGSGMHAGGGQAVEHSAQHRLHRGWGMDAGAGGKGVRNKGSSSEEVRCAFRAAGQQGQRGTQEWCCKPPWQ